MAAKSASGGIAPSGDVGSVGGATGATAVACRRGRTAQGHPNRLGATDFVEDLEAKFQVRLRPLPPGTPSKKPAQRERAAAESARLCKDGGQSGRGVRQPPIFPA